MDEKPVKTDMRWVRTERHLLEAFGKAIEDAPIEKITVTGIARAAEVNKATFYLHYRDIYDLGQAYVNHLARIAVEAIGNPSALFSDPHSFVIELMGVLGDEENERMVEAIARNGLVPHYMDALVDHLNSKLRSVQPIPDDLRGKVALSFFLHGAMGALAQYRESENREELAEIIGDLLETLMAHGNAIAAREGIAFQSGQSTPEHTRKQKR